MQSPAFDDVVDQIVQHDPRFHRDAYVFVREALDHTQKLFLKSNKKPGSHVSGQQLLHGLREYALEKFGPMASTLFEEWGVRRCEDFGDIVFNMVDHALLAKTDSDRRADFAGGYDFDKAFREPFRPAPPQSPLASQPKSTQV